MIKRSDVSFNDLSQLLQGLGFAVSKRGKFWCFEHPPSETILEYRPYQEDETITMLDLHRTRQDLEWRGLLSDQAFDDRLKKATA